MNVLIDTNILISAMIWRGSTPARALLHAAEHHKVILCEQNLEELRSIVDNKFPKYKTDIDLFLSSFRFEIIPPIRCDQDIIRDLNDQQILNAAIIFGVDIIVTGDKDFLVLNLERPTCMTASDFLEKTENDNVVQN